MFILMYRRYWLTCVRVRMYATKVVDGLNKEVTNAYRVLGVTSDCTKDQLQSSYARQFRVGT